MARYCSKCGNPMEEDSKFCSKCGNGSEQANVGSNSQGKSKIGAGLLGIFLGAFGVHNFYLGYTSKAVTQLLLTVIGWVAFGIGPLVAYIWGLVEGIQILTGTINVDADGNHLSDV